MTWRYWRGSYDTDQPFVRISVRVTGSSQTHSRTALRNCGKTRRRGYLSTSMPNAWSDWHSRAGVSFTTAFQEGISVLRKDEESRLGRSVLPARFSLELVWTESSLSCFRLELAIKNWKPASAETDPTTNFWTAYKRVADEHDHDMTSKYLGDLDTSLLFVSAVTSPAHATRLIQALPLH